MLRIHDLKKTFAVRPVLKGINLELDRGMIYGLLGPNGAGKTTTMKILAGLLFHDGGDIFIDGERFHRDNTAIKRKIAYVPDQPFVYPKLTGEEHLHFYADLYQIPYSHRKDKFAFYFDYFEFEPYRHELVETYSAGTRQKLLISQALLVEPAILLLDEPLTSIDPLVSRKFKQLIRQTAEKGTIILFATHILSLAQEVSGRIGIIIGGRIVFEDSVDALMARANGDLEEFYYQTVMTHATTD